ncbi:MAG: superoxide dismutase family protein [Rubricoccaceae bacterium]
MYPVALSLLLLAEALAGAQAVPRGAPAPRAAAVLEPTGRSDGIRGTVYATRYAEGTRVRAVLRGFGRDGLFGFQVLDAASCADAPRAPVLGDAAHPHGSPYDPPALRRAGSLGNVHARRGVARYDRLDPLLDLGDALGRIVVVRARQDDGITPPDGAAGPVVACGVLRPAP